MWAHTFHQRSQLSINHVGAHIPQYFVQLFLQKAAYTNKEQLCLYMYSGQVSQLGENIDIRPILYTTACLVGPIMEVLAFRHTHTAQHGILCPPLTNTRENICSIKGLFCFLCFYFFFINVICFNSCKCFAAGKRILRIVPLGETSSGQGQGWALRSIPF